MILAEFAGKLFNLQLVCGIRCV